MKLRTVIFVAILMFVMSCGRFCGQQAYRNIIHESTERFEHTAPPEQIWKETRGLIEQRAFKFVNAPLPTKEAALTEWRGDEKYKQRYSVRIIEGTSGSRLEVHVTTDMEVGVWGDVGAGKAPEVVGHKRDLKTTRDLDIEWGVVRILAPDHAKTVEEAAIARRDEVRDVVGSGCQ